MRCRIEVRHGQGVVDVYDIEGPEAIVGTSVNATISLPQLKDLSPEHMLLIPRGGSGCWVSVGRGVRTPVKVANETLTSAMVAWGTDLQVGPITIRPCLATFDLSRVRDPRTVLLLAMVGGIAVIAMRSAAGAGAVSLENVAVQVPPPLFGARSVCVDHEDAFGSGFRAEEMARSRADRYPYDPRDGVRGVRDYATAASCYDSAGRQLDASRARVAGQELKNRVVADYAALRLRLENAIESERWLDVLRDTRHLQLLTSHLGGHEYVEWLKNVVGKATARHHDPP